MIRKVFLALLLALLLVGCSPVQETVAVPHGTLASLLMGSGFSFQVPTELPSGFIQAGMTCLNGRTASLSYGDGQRVLTFWAASSVSDEDVTAQVEALPHRILLEINGHMVAYHTQAEDAETGSFLWSQGDATYCLTGATPQEAAGMLYSMADASTLTERKDLGRPRTEFASVEALAENMGITLPQPVSLADDYHFSSCYGVAGLIAVTEYTNDDNTLIYQVSPSELVFTPDAGGKAENQTLYSGTDYTLSVTLISAGEAGYGEARWQIGGLYYRLSAVTPIPREQILTLAREFSSWLEQ